ncbi:MAG: hypothetical protein Q7T05_02270 [Dehalococcoidia bacterium]|nr:hypothetical protein [Dehalococcoidia bacterium]
MASKLPTFRGYTVDRRLKEFRLCRKNRPIVYVPFDSRKGMKLLEAFEGKERR